MYRYNLFRTPAKSRGFRDTKIPADLLSAGILLLQSLFQSIGIQRRQPDTGETVFGCEHEGLGQIITGNHFAVPFRLLQKFPGPFGGGGIVQIKDPNDGPVPDCHIVAYR